jgi:hypothetical protein
MGIIRTHLYISIQQNASTLKQTWGSNAPPTRKDKHMNKRDYEDLQSLRYTHHDIITVATDLSTAFKINEEDIEGKRKYHILAYKNYYSNYGDHIEGWMYMQNGRNMPHAAALAFPNIEEAVQFIQDFKALLQWLGEFAKNP